MSRDRLSVPQTSSAVQITIVVSLNLVLALLTILSSSPCRVQIFLNGSRTRVYNYPYTFYLSVLAVTMPAHSRLLEIRPVALMLSMVLKRLCLVTKILISEILCRS